MQQINLTIFSTKSIASKYNNWQESTIFIIIIIIINKYTFAIMSLLMTDV